MCRFALYLGPPLGIDALLTRPVNSIIRQSFQNQEREEPLNGDGFGVAWYVPEITEEPAVFRSISPAWSNQNLLSLARVTRSGCVLAHVRAATPGLPVSEANCHPFTEGRLSFMHNGDLAGFRTFKRRLSQSLSERSYHQIGGTTDSEHLFALFCDELAAGGDDGVQGMAAALERTIARAVAFARETTDEISYLNIALSDGKRAVAARFTTGPPETAESLYYHTGRRYECDGDTCRMVEPDADESAVLVCSERLSEDPGWDRIAGNQMVVIDEDHHVSLHALG